jgi:hypothetical protein
LAPIALQAQPGGNQADGEMPAKIAFGIRPTYGIFVLLVG